MQINQLKRLVPDFFYKFRGTVAKKGDKQLLQGIMINLSEKKMSKRYKEAENPFKWKHFSGEIILWGVRWYGRYALSYKDLQEIFQERGLKVCRSTLCRWVNEYAPLLSKRVKPYLKKTSVSWRVDETYLKVKGVWHYLYRAIDKEGNTLDWHLSGHRNKQVAKRFFRKILGNANIRMPKVINVDRNPAFVPAHKELLKEGDFVRQVKLRQVKYLNNTIENDHKCLKRKARYRQWFQSFSTARNTIDSMETMRLIQKEQVRLVPKGNVAAQNQFVHRLFGVNL